jgi:hypothetical protein
MNRIWKRPRPHLHWRERRSLRRRHGSPRMSCPDLPSPPVSLSPRLRVTLLRVPRRPPWRAAAPASAVALHVPASPEQRGGSPRRPFPVSPGHPAPGKHGGPYPSAEAEGCAGTCQGREGACPFCSRHGSVKVARNLRPPAFICAPFFLRCLA